MIRSARFEIMLSFETELHFTIYFGAEKEKPIKRIPKNNLSFKG